MNKSMPIYHNIRGFETQGLGNLKSLIAIVTLWTLGNGELVCNW